MPRPSKNIRLANKATEDELSSLLAPPSGFQYQLAVVHALNLTEAERNRCWDLLEQNMKDMYIESSWGWHPADKLEELFHPDARFILVRRMLAEGLSEVVAFLSFRFDMEEGEEVAYLTTLDANTAANAPALKLYESLGFVLHPTSPGYVDEGSESDEEWVDEDEETDDYRILYCRCA
ncbi:acyl-CoA N-acyltransferase [Schizophyllum commune]